MAKLVVRKKLEQKQTEVIRNHAEQRLHWLHGLKTVKM